MVEFAANAAEDKSAFVYEQQIKMFHNGDSCISGEIENLSEENVKYFNLGSGANIVVIYSEPPHYRDANGNWN